MPACAKYSLSFAGTASGMSWPRAGEYTTGYRRHDCRASHAASLYCGPQRRLTRSAPCPSLSSSPAPDPPPTRPGSFFHPAPVVPFPSESLPPCVAPHLLPRLILDPPPPSPFAFTLSHLSTTLSKANSAFFLPPRPRARPRDMVPPRRRPRPLSIFHPIPVYPPRIHRPLPLLSRSSPFPSPSKFLPTHPRPLGPVPPDNPTSTLPLCSPPSDAHPSNLQVPARRAHFFLLDPGGDCTPLRAGK
ncbi:hypothetical protein K438DRAFT_2022614 [Mycena galopus ATCC 62051]|nr:hypothetical protein K438DRAFT_2022614 [Mycena galopus ATCC 62051]